MKKGYFEIKRWNSDIDTFEVYFVEKQRFTATRQDLKDLRSLIDTVLGQPLTEGEGKIPCLCPKWFSDGMGGYVKNIFPANEHVEPCPLLKPQQESKEEVRMGATGKPPFGLYEEPSKKEEQRCGGLGCKLPWQHPGACYPGVSQEPSKKPVCYCGHPKERHFVQYKSLVEGNQLSCRHCECFEYADNELHNQGKI